MSRIQGLYSTVNPDRINPEFIGIGQKLSEHKRNRVGSDKHRKTIQSNFAFTLKVNEELQKNLQSKQRELQRLQKARQRHHDDINHKLNEEQRKQRQLQQLKMRSTQQRISIKNGIKSVRDSLKSDRLANKISTNQQLYEKSQQLKAENDALMSERSMKYKSVEMGKKFGNERVNQYYRQKNLQSYNEYVRRIQEQDGKSNSNLQSIKRMHSQMKKLEKKIHKKQEKLKQIVSQINMYAVECQNQRKVNFLATVEVFRPSSTSSSWRSRPTQILRTSIHKTRNEDEEKFEQN